MTASELFDRRIELADTLKQNVCVVSFKKKNGEMREMLCTNRKDLVPQSTLSEQDLKNQKMTPRVVNMATIPVFDLNKRDYRSFLIENLLDIKILQKEEIGQYVESNS